MSPEELRHVYPNDPPAQPPVASPSAQSVFGSRVDKAKSLLDDDMGHNELPQPPSTPVFGSMMDDSPKTLTAGGPVPADDKPIAVVRVLSVRGVEYGMMTIALWVVAVTLAWVVLNMLNGSHGFNYLVVPTSSLVICVPVFAFFFLRLKRAELADSDLKLDPSKRRWSQITQFLAYISVLVNLIYFVYLILEQTSGGHKTSIGKAIGNLLVILVIAGGILAYYWVDEHRLVKR